MRFRAEEIQPLRPLISPERRRRAVDVARRHAVADLLITNVRLVNTFTSEVYPAQIAVVAGIIAAVVPADEPTPQAVDIFDAGGRFAIPGLIDSHLHIESSMVLPAAFAAMVVPRGVLTVIADPHEIANVMGVPGIQLLAEASRGLPLDVFWAAPSCVPATSLETAGAEIGPEEIRDLLQWDTVVALGEVMDFPAVIAQEGRASAVLAEAVREGAVIEGHAPNLSGSDLAAYIAAGVTSDHTFVTPALAQERLRNGVTLQLQLKSLALETIATAQAQARSLNLCLVTDDVMPDDLVATGHLDHIFRRAVKLGLDPIEAVRATTLAPARRMRLEDRGALAPGYLAHIVLTSSLEEFHPDAVFHAGRLVAQDGTLLDRLPEIVIPAAARSTVRVKPPSAEMFRLRATGTSVTVRVIGMRAQTTYTDAQTAVLPVRDGYIVWEGEDLSLAAVVERHGRSGTIGYGLVRGALSRGAVAMSWAHDSHNLLVVGRSAHEMAAAAAWVIQANGGIVAVHDTSVLATVSLPIAGLVSDRSVPEIATELTGFRTALKTLGFTHSSPIMALGALTLAVSPALKLTDRGLVDVVRGTLVPLIMEGDRG